VHATIRSESVLESGTRWAFDLAASHGAHVTAFLSEVEPFAASIAPPDNVQGGIRPRVQLSRGEEAERIASLIHATASQQGVECEVLISDSEGQVAAAQLARRAPVRDLVVMTVYGPVQDRRLAFVQGVLFRTGRPLMLVPSQVGPLLIRKVVVAWDATRSASRAFHDALPLLATAAEVSVVTVLGDKELQPEESGEEACRALDRRNISARFLSVQNDAQHVGATLLEAATRVEADVLVMSGFAHSMERELIFGSATRFLFGSGFPFPILLSH
jgi:nucleotide-binding universal stress UspA family protein